MTSYEEVLKISGEFAGSTVTRLIAPTSKISST